MKIGIVGSGRVGFSMGRYLADHRVDVVGFYDRHPERAAEGAAFCRRENELSEDDGDSRQNGCHADSFLSLEALVEASDTLFLTTPDGEIARVWDCIGQLPMENKIICHFSGSLSSVVFHGIEQKKAFGCSVHPMLAFSDKYSSYRQLSQAFFTIEGDERATAVMTGLLNSLGNQVVQIDADKKALYHCAASILSNQVVAVLDSGFRLLRSIGFSAEQVQEATESLVLGNVSRVLEAGCENALTGPVERGDTATVIKHLLCLADEDYEMYLVLGKKLVEIAGRKHPMRSYDDMKQIFAEAEKKEVFREKYSSYV